MNMVKLNPFQTYWSLGYRRLVPVIPHDAPVSATSSLHRAVGKPNDPRGKAVGVKRRDGLWSGFDWVPYEADEHDVERWSAMGAGVGIKTGLQHDGRTLIGIDADTLDGDHARTIRDAIEARLGRLPVRVGRYPKALYLCRVSEPYRYTRVDFGPNLASQGKSPHFERVEILSDGRQFVAHGIHPTTKNPYGWPREIMPYGDLPTFTADQIDAVMRELQDALPQAAQIVREGAASDVPQERLHGRLEAVREAVAAIPNSSEHFATRESYLAVGYAIKAALPDHAQEAFDLFAEWCARWQDGDNEPDVIRSDWNRMKPPYKRGAAFLYELAATLGHDETPYATQWFDDEDAKPPVELNPFEAVAQKEAEREKADTFPVLRVGDILNRPPPKYLVARHIAERGVGFVYSEPGAGKTFLVLDMVLSIATGLPTWHGDEINAPEGAAVLYIAAEGSYGFRNRIKAWLNRRGLSDDQAKSFFMIERTINFMSPDDVQKLIRTIQAVQAAASAAFVVVVVDTVSRALPGADENLQKDMTRFVQACDLVRDTFGCAVIGVHHAGKSGDMRGSTVLRGAGDFVFRLERKKGATVGTLDCEKQKDAPDGWSEPYRFDVVPIGEGETSLVVERAETAVGPRTELTPDVASAVLSAMAKAWDDSAPWSPAPQSGERRAVRRMVLDFGFDATKAEELLSVWEQTGVIERRTLSAKHRLNGFYVRERPGQAVQNDDIFD